MASVCLCIASEMMNLLLMFWHCTSHNICQPANAVRNVIHMRKWSHASTCFASGAHSGVSQDLVREGKVADDALRKLRDNYLSCHLALIVAQFPQSLVSHVALTLKVLRMSKLPTYSSMLKRWRW